MASRRVVSGLVCGLLVVIVAGCIHAPPLKVVPSLPRPRPVFVSPLPQMDMVMPLTWRVYMPFVASGTPDADATCFGNDKALAFYQLLKADPRQQRVSIVCNAALVRAANERAHGLANGDPWAHKDKFGVTPNEYARRAGCQLPPSYPTIGNGIESLTAGMQDPAVALWSLTNGVSLAHRRHLLAETDYYRAQTQIGIGFARGGGEYQYYWVFLSSVCE